MATFENIVTIQRPIDEVFTFLADFENIPTWNHSVLETRKLTTGAVGIGTAYRQTRSLPNRSEETFAVAAYEPVTRLAIAGDIGPFRARFEYELEATANGAELTNIVDLKPSSPLLKVAAPIVVPKIKAAVADNLHTLKAILEGERSAGILRMQVNGLDVTKRGRDL